MTELKAAPRLGEDWEEELSGAITFEAAETVRKINVLPDEQGGIMLSFTKEDICVFIQIAPDGGIFNVSIGRTKTT
jgi:hypothetical protein